MSGLAAFMPNSLSRPLPPGVLSPSWRGCLAGRTNLRIVLRTKFVLIKVEPGRIKGFQGLAPLYGMQGVRSSSLLGSIELNRVHDWVLTFLNFMGVITAGAFVLPL